MNSEAAVRLYNMTTICKPGKYELEIIIDIVTLELDSVDLELVCFIGTFEQERSKDTKEKSSLLRGLIKSWVKDGFILVLKENCSVFDLLFCNQWRLSIWRVVVALIRPWIVAAKNLEEINMVFCREPSYIYLLDLRKCLKHLLHGKTYSCLPASTNIAKPREFEVFKNRKENYK